MKEPEDKYKDGYSLQDEEDNRNLAEYNLEEEDKVINNMETGGGEYSLEDDEEAWSGETIKKPTTPLEILWKVLATPVEGWKLLRRSKYGVATVSLKMFYPILIIAGLSNLTSLFYEVGISISEILIKVVFTMIVFFFGYFTTLLAGGVLLCNEARLMLHNYFGKEFIMYCVSTLALFYIMFRILPMAAPIIGFLPLWTIYIICKGIKFFRVPAEKETQTIVILSSLIIGLPLIWEWLLGKMI